MSEIHVLVVDDEKEIADLVEIYLVSDGYKVYKASNALEGLEILEKETIHLVLLDIMMPGMDGLEMCRKIRETNNIPIIMPIRGGSSAPMKFLRRCGMRKSTRQITRLWYISDGFAAR